MRIEDVPQDSSILDGHLRACYARDADGRFVLATSRGWDVESVANAVAVEQVRAGIERVRVEVVAGRASILAWHMARAHMDARMLAAHAGFWVWRVKRHLRPEVFARLGESVLKRYAAALGIDVALLKSGLPE